MTELSPHDTYIILAVLLVLAIVVVVVDGALLVMWAASSGSRDPERPRLFAPTWSLVHPWVAGQVVVAMLLAGVVVAAIPMAVTGEGFTAGAAPPMGLMLYGLLLQNGLLVAVPAFVILALYGETLGSIGASWAPSRRQIAWGIAGGLALLLVGLALEAGIGVLLKNLAPAGAAGMLERLTKAFSVESVFPNVRSDWGQFVALFVGAAIAAPIGEEFFFRGFLHNAARRRFGVRWGAVVSATVFALVHGGPILVLAILPMGLVLAWLYERTGSLWPSIIAHAVNNGVLVCAMRFGLGGGS